MPIPYSHSYYFYHIPLDEVLAVYDSSFRGSQHLGGLPSAIALGNQIDEYVYSLAKSDSELSIVPQVSKFIADYDYMNECCTHLRDKLDAAFIVRHLYRTKKLQSQIEQKANTFYHTSIMNRYYGVPESLLLELKSEISWFKRVLENVSTHNNSAYFKERIYEPVFDAISKYYLVFDLNQQPLSEKAKDVAFEGGMKIGCFVIFCLIFWLIAKIMCG